MKFTNRLLATIKKTIHFKTISKAGAIFLPILSLAACGEKTMTGFDWLASESASENFPMEIIKGTFHIKEGGGQYVPSGVLL